MGTIARPPPGVAFGRGGGDGQGAPLVTFEAKRAFDAFADSLTAEAMNRAIRPYDSNRPMFDDNAVSGPPPGCSRGGDSSLEKHDTSGVTRGEAAVRATRDIATRSHARGGEPRSLESPLDAFGRVFQSKRAARATPPPFHTVPTHIPPAQDMRREAAMDCGVSGSRYPNGPYEEFSWVFDREPAEKYTESNPDFKRHFASLKPVHHDESLGEPVDLRPLVKCERDTQRAMHVERANARKYDACHKTLGPHDKPPRPFARADKLPHKPGYFASASPVKNAGTLDADGRLVASPPERWKSVARSIRAVHRTTRDTQNKTASKTELNPAVPRRNARLAGAASTGGGFFAPHHDSDALQTRHVKACSAYATRLIANGRVGGTVVPTDALGRRVGNPLIGATASGHVKNGAPLGSFVGTSVEQEMRSLDKASEMLAERKSAARRARIYDIDNVGGFGFEKRLKEKALEVASVRSFRDDVDERCEKANRGAPKNARASFMRSGASSAMRVTGDTRRERLAFARRTPGVVREYSNLTLGASPLVAGEVWTPGASAVAAVGNWTWRNAQTPPATSLDKGDVLGLPRHSAARARVRQEESVRKLSLRPSATFV